MQFGSSGWYVPLHILCICSDRQQGLYNIFLGLPYVLNNAALSLSVLPALRYFIIGLYRLAYENKTAVCHLEPGSVSAIFIMRGREPTLSVSQI